jgi:hypothetical protein
MKELLGRKLNNTDYNIIDTNKNPQRPYPLSSTNQFIKTKKAKVLFIISFMILSVVLALIPHQATINKTNQPIGVDTAHYVLFINNLSKANNTLEFLRQAFVVQSGGDRPVFLILSLAFIKTLSPNDNFALNTLSSNIELLPILLGPALVLAVYFLTRELTSKNDAISLLSAFLTAISFQTLIGIYAGFYANWFALIIGYLSIAFLIRFLKKSTKTNFVLYSSFLILLLFSHVYTWSILTTVIGILLIVLLKLNCFCRRKVILLLLVVISSVVIDVVRMEMTGSSGGIERDMQVAGVGLGFTQFAVRWTTLIHTVQVSFGAAYSNFIILGLCLYWLIRSKSYHLSEIFIMVFLSIGIIPLFFGSSLVQSRVLYDIPFQIPAAFGLTRIPKQKATGNIVFLAICIWLLAISIRDVSNFGF